MTSYSVCWINSGHAYECNQYSKAQMPRLFRRSWHALNEIKKGTVELETETLPECKYTRTLFVYGSIQLDENNISKTCQICQVQVIECVRGLQTTSGSMPISKLISGTASIFNSSADSSDDEKTPRGLSAGRTKPAALPHGTNRRMAESLRFKSVDCAGCPSCGEVKALRNCASPSLT